MALRAGYYGIKNKLLKQLINIPAQIMGKADASLLATVQTELTADKAYEVGEQFIYNQLLYKVTQPIASGAAITIGTNAVVAGSVTEQLSQDTRVSLLWDSGTGSLQLNDDLSKYRLINVEMVFYNNSILGTYHSILVPCNIFKLHNSENDYYKFEVYTTTRNSYAFYVLDDNHICVTEKPSSSTSNWYLRIYGIK